MKPTLLIAYSNLGLGGIPTKIVDIVNQMKTTHPDTAITIFLKKRSRFDIREKIGNPNVTIIDHYKHPFLNNSLIYTFRLWFLLIVKKPHAMLAFISAYALPVLATRILFFWRKPIIIVNEDHYTSTMIGYMKLPSLQHAGIKLLYNLATVIIVPTRAVERNLQDCFHVKHNLIKVVPNWSRHTNKTISSTKKRRVDVAYLGRIEKTKNVLTIINILKMVIVKNTPLLTSTIVGEGKEIKTCVDYILKYNLEKNIKILPSTNDVSTHLLNTKMLIFYPDKSTEGMPFVLLDAMSCGTIVVTKHFLGVESIIENKITGYIAKTKKEMESHIDHILNNYSSHQSMITTAKAYVIKNHSINNVSQYTKWLSFKYE
ncbi:glycosyltransferase family 4 protein [Patescibacteria group bacterium]